MSTPPPPPPNRSVPPPMPQRALPIPPRPVKKLQQQTLLEVPEDWQREWQGMPEFEKTDQKSMYQLKVHFASLDDAMKFGEIIGQKVTSETKSFWWPKQAIKTVADKRYVDEESPLAPHDEDES